MRERDIFVVAVFFVIFVHVICMQLEAEWHHLFGIFFLRFENKTLLLYENYHLLEMCMKIQNYFDSVKAKTQFYSIYIRKIMYVKWKFVFKQLNAILYFY